MLGVIAFFGVAMGIGVNANKEADPGVGLAVPLFFAGLFVVVAWRYFPEAKAFGWLRRRAGVRLLRRADWDEVSRSCPALILPFGRRILPALRARFRREACGRYPRAGLRGVVAVLDRIDPSWPADEVGFLQERLSEDIERPGRDFLCLLPLLDRADPNWPAASRGVSDQLVKGLMLSLTPFHTRQASPDRFAVKNENRGRGPIYDGITKATATPGLEWADRALLEELSGRLGLLERAIRHGAGRPAESVLRELVSWPDLGLRGEVGWYLEILVNEKDDRFEERRSEVGIKKIISTATVRQAAQEQLAIKGPK